MSLSQAILNHLLFDYCPHDGRVSIGLFSYNILLLCVAAILEQVSMTDHERSKTVQSLRGSHPRTCMNIINTRIHIRLCVISMILVLNIVALTRMEANSHLLKRGGGHESLDKVAVIVGESKQCPVYQYDIVLSINKKKEKYIEFYKEFMKFLDYVEAKIIDIKKSKIEGDKIKLQTLSSEPSEDDIYDIVRLLESIESYKIKSWTVSLEPSEDDIYAIVRLLESYEIKSWTVSLERLLESYKIKSWTVSLERLLESYKIKSWTVSLERLLESYKKKLRTVSLELSEDDIVRLLESYKIKSQTVSLEPSEDDIYDIVRLLESTEGDIEIKTKGDKVKSSLSAEPRVASECFILLESTKSIIEDINFFELTEHDINFLVLTEDGIKLLKLIDDDKSQLSADFCSSFLNGPILEQVS